MKHTTLQQVIIGGLALLLLWGVGRMSGNLKLSPAAPASPVAPAISEAERAAQLLGGSELQVKQIELIAQRYHVSPEEVADKAAKTAEICGRHFIGAPQAWAFGSLIFVEGHTEETKIDDAFVAYVLMQCPT